MAGPGYNAPLWHPNTMRLSTMAEDWTVRVRHGIQLPLRNGPIKFAVTMSGGSTSNAWRVWTETRDAYICCRDNMGEIKISLHGSGKQHIAFRSETGIEMTPGSRFWNQWHEPPQQDPAIPSFKLVFPPWGVRLTEDERRKTRRIREKWEDNQILLEGDDQLLTVVSFVVLDESKSLNFVGEYPKVLMGILPFVDGKNLLVVGGKEPERNFRDVMQEALFKIVQDPPDTVCAALEAQAEGEVLTMCATGDNPEGYAYLVAFPVEVKPGQPQRDVPN